MHKKEISYGEYKKAERLANQFMEKCIKSGVTTLEFELAICH